MPVKVSAAAVTESIFRLAEMELTPASVAALQAFVVAKRLATQGLDPSIATVNAAVDEVFVLFPDNLANGRISFGSEERDGQLALKWLKVASKSGRSGQSTVWNVTTRGVDRPASNLFQGGDIRNGLRPDAAKVLAASLQTKGPKPVKPNRQALATFLVRDATFDDDPDAAKVLAKLSELFGITSTELASFTTSEALAKPLNGEPRWSPDQLPDVLKPDAPHVAATRGVALVGSGAEVVVDQRIMRMVRLAIQSSSAVMLVGPPGTGKTTLLRQVIDEFTEDPAAFGFDRPDIPPPMVETPDESWTALELVGGKTVDEQGRLRFRPGALLEAIRQDRWLVLDEANRADMDKIFGPLLTWLSDQPVELGRATTGINSPVIELGWRSDAESKVDPAELKQLEAETPKGERISFLAGRDWRLLGTYNALDAQRVFRFGQALGRRFARVPIPCPTDTEFRKALMPAAAGLPEGVVSQIVALYKAHLDDPMTVLGPAIFLRIPSYILAGLGVAADDYNEAVVHGDSAVAGAGETLTSGTQTDSGTEIGQGEGSPEMEIPAVTGEAVGEVTSAVGSGERASGARIAKGHVDIDSLLAEGYLINAGTWVATLDDGLKASLGRRILDYGGLREEQWIWVKKMLPSLG